MKVAANMQATLTLASNSYRLDALDVTLDGSGAAWPGGPGQAHLKFDSLTANLGDESLDLGGLTLDFLGVTAAGSLKGEKLMSNLALTGAVDIREFAPGGLLERFGVKLETADSDVMKRASAKANLSYNSRADRVARHAARARRFEAHRPRGARGRARHVRPHRRRHQRGPLSAALEQARQGRRRLARRGGPAARRAAQARRSRAS